MELKLKDLQDMVMHKGLGYKVPQTVISLACSYDREENSDAATLFIQEETREIEEDKLPQAFTHQRELWYDLSYDEVVALRNHLAAIAEVMPKPLDENQFD